MSTLHPGRTSNVVKKLREAAITEMDAIPVGEKKVKGLKFDVDHSKTSQIDDEGGDESDNWVARYPGQNSPHIGNGSGGPIGGGGAT